MAVKIYARQGIQLDRPTLADWVGLAAWYLRPLRDHILERLRRSQRLFADETTAPVLDPGRGRTKAGQLWAYARDVRPSGGNEFRSPRVKSEDFRLQVWIKHWALRGHDLPSQTPLTSADTMNKILLCIISFEFKLLSLQINVTEILLFHIIMVILMGNYTQPKY